MDRALLLEDSVTALHAGPLGRLDTHARQGRTKEDTGGITYGPEEPLSSQRLCRARGEMQAQNQSTETDNVDRTRQTKALWEACSETRRWQLGSRFVLAESCNPWGC